MFGSMETPLRPSVINLLERQGCSNEEIEAAIEEANDVHPHLPAYICNMCIEELMPIVIAEKQNP